MSKSHVKAPEWGLLRRLGSDTFKAQGSRWCCAQALLTMFVNLIVYHSLSSFFLHSDYWTQHVSNKAERHKNDFQSGNTLYSCMVSSIDRPVLLCWLVIWFGLLQRRHLMRHLGHVRTNAQTFGNQYLFFCFGLLSTLSWYFHPCKRFGKLSQK